MGRNAVAFEAGSARDQDFVVCNANLVNQEIPNRPGSPDSFAHAISSAVHAARILVPDDFAETGILQKIPQDNPAGRTPTGWLADPHALSPQGSFQSFYGFGGRQ